MIGFSATKRSIYPNNGHHASEEFKLYRSISDKSELLALRPGYSISPPPEYILHRHFVVQDLEICFSNTKVKWTGIVNLNKMKVPLRDLIDLGKHYI